MTSRRLLLKLAAACFGSLGLPAAARRAHGTMRSSDPTAARMLGRAVTEALRAPEAACAVGRTALAAGSCDPGLEHLTGALLKTLGSDSQTIAMTAAPDLRAQLGAACRADFAAGRTVLVHGWLLSRTEVTVSGIAHLCDEARA